MSDVKLWGAVITQAIEDATRRVPCGLEGKPKAIARARREAREWLTTPSADFDDVCALAELDPRKVRAFAAERIAAADANGIAAPPPARPRRPSRHVRIGWRKGENHPRAKVIEFNGEQHTITEWAQKIGIAPHTLTFRLKNWTLERALTTPGAGRNFRETERDRRGILNARVPENRVFAE